MVRMHHFINGLVVIGESTENGENLVVKNPLIVVTQMINGQPTVQFAEFAEFGKENEHKFRENTLLSDPYEVEEKMTKMYKNSLEKIKKIKTARNTGILTPLNEGKIIKPN